MKTLFGMSYEQMMTLPADQLNALQTEHCINEVGRNFIIPTLGEPEAVKADYNAAEFISVFKIVATRKIHAMFNNLCDQAYYDKLRLIYDNEHKFLLGVEIAESASKLSSVIQDTVGEIISEMAGEDALDELAKDALRCKMY